MQAAVDLHGFEVCSFDEAAARDLILRLQPDIAEGACCQFQTQAAPDAGFVEDGRDYFRRLGERPVGKDVLVPDLAGVDAPEAWHTLGKALIRSGADVARGVELCLAAAEAGVTHAELFLVHGTARKIFTKADQLLRLCRVMAKRNAPYYTAFPLLVLAVHAAFFPDGCRADALRYLEVPLNQNLWHAFFVDGILALLTPTPNRDTTRAWVRFERCVKTGGDAKKKGTVTCEELAWAANNAGVCAACGRIGEATPNAQRMFETALEEAPEAPCSDVVQRNLDRLLK